MTRPRAPLAVARAGIALAVQALPHRADRDRYGRELVAELHGLPVAAQLQHTAGVLSRVLCLRAALAAARSDDEEVGMTSTRNPRSWRCRLLGWHAWTPRSNPDGGRFQQCARCGTDRGPVSNLPTSTPPWPDHAR
ncbi:hypothetical protein GB931_15790 [Modestobacter sp. I12A-02628]|nr:hypothetical protein [Goekera deserti]MPQ97135.1 hypothetical protein [Goekera deserti]MPQ99352.1 hypothetical protein [Goekera deserti]NDI46547.1 hypothetical protein [Goekera deserti]NDI50351.1 hypothetical protein [Goekera deserti]